MKLYILNDDVNSFEHVIQCIQKYLNYPYMQGVSIAHIVNDSGKCLVKESDDEVRITEIYENLVKQGLSLRIEN
jgi:ATP-dependent Clp protease adaptor protein ClpS